MTAAAKTTPDTVTIRSIADAAWLDAANLTEATDRFIDELRQYPILHAEFMEIPERQAARDYLGKLVRRERQTIWGQTAQTDNRVYRLAASGHRLLMDMRLPGGVRLGDATADDLDLAAKFYHKQGTDMLQKAAFFRAVGASLPAGKRVADKFTEKKLRRLHLEATK